MAEISWVLAIAFLYGIAALGVTFAFRVVGFADMTPDGSFLLGTGLAARALSEELPTALVLFLVIGAGALAGVLPALLCVRIRISPLLSGILSSLVLYSVALGIMGRSNIPIRHIDIWAVRVFRGTAMAAIALACVVLASALLFWLLHTNIGLRMRATGDAPNLAANRGWQTSPLVLLGLMTSNSLAALSGALVCILNGFADASSGVGVTVICLAAIVLGEALLRPERVGVLLCAPIAGMVAYQAIIATALRIGMQPVTLRAVMAVMAVGVLALNRWRQREASRMIGNRSV